MPKPSPFAKPSITLSETTLTVRKAWQDIPADHTNVDDIVQGHNRGLVTSIYFFDLTWMGIQFQNGSVEKWRRSDIVRVFTRVRDGDSE